MWSEMVVKSVMFAGFEETDIEVCKSGIWFDTVCHGGKLRKLNEADNFNLLFVQLLSPLKICSQEDIQRSEPSILSALRNTHVYFSFILYSYLTRYVHIALSFYQLIGRSRNIYLTRMTEFCFHPRSCIDGISQMSYMEFFFYAYNTCYQWPEWIPILISNLPFL